MDTAGTVLAQEQPAPADEAGGAVRWRAFCAACRQVLGLPDYERYLAHAHVTHPGAPLMTREEFVARAIERRYGGGMGRCC